jgi:hypothetical protein
MVTQLQARMWKRMLQLLDDHARGQLPLHRLVDGLEGALDTGDFRDPALMREWYAYWTPLEELDEESARDLEEPGYAVTRPLVEAMKSYLRTTQEQWGRPMQAVARK